QVVPAQLPEPARTPPRAQPLALPQLRPLLPPVVVEHAALPEPFVERLLEPALEPALHPTQQTTVPLLDGSAGGQPIAVASVTPPRYPAVAMRRGLEGTVVLRVMIDASGVPEAVRIERSSGHRELDRAAREHVLAAWRFHP